MEKADLLVSGGGSLLQDVTSLRSALYYLGIILMAKSARLPAVFYAQGVGPLKSRLLRRLTGIILNRMERVVVRDEPSSHLLREIGVTRPVSCSADPAFALEPEPVDCSFLPPAPRVGIALRPWNDLRHCCQVIEELILRLLNQPEQYSVVFIPMHYPHDYHLSQKIVERIRGKAATAVSEGKGAERVMVIGREFPPNELLSIFSEMMLVIGMRLHALIMALSSGVPVLGLDYDPKIESLLAAFSCRPVGRPGTIELEPLWSRVQEVLAAQEELTARFRTKALDMKGQVENEIEAIAAEFLM